MRIHRRTDLSEPTPVGAGHTTDVLVSLTDTADLYATATGFIERSAAAYASGAPRGAGDDGFFGPASVTWRMNADLASPAAGLRSLLMQALHPLAMAGVDQHSGWRIHDHVRGTDPVTGRPYPADDPSLLLWCTGRWSSPV